MLAADQIDLGHRVQPDSGEAVDEQAELEVEAEKTSLVVISQTYYHRWRAYLDGDPRPVLRANYAFQAVEVPAGKHHLRLAYEDRPFHIGAAISAAALVLCLCGWRLTRAR